MRIPILLSLVCLAFAPAVLAQEADLAIVSAQLSKTTVVTGERFTITTQVRNDGPNTARDVLVSFGSNLGLFTVSITAPDGWNCSRNQSVPASATCTTPTFRANTTADFQAVVLAPANTAPGPVTAHVLTSASTGDDRPTNNNRLIPITLNAAATSADLLVALTPRDSPVAPGAQTTVDVHVTNNGPAAANDVFVSIDSSAFTPLALVGVAANWTCTPTAQPSTLCRTSAILAGATSTFALRFRAPDRDGGASLFARVQAEGNRDQSSTNDFAFTTIAIGSAQSWRRILLPLTATNIPGANGSLWKSDITALIRSESQIEVTPGPCDRIIVLCPGLPLNQPFDGGAQLVNDLTLPGGQFVWVRDVNEDKIRFNMRVYDVSRLTETAGAEVPIVREHEFTSGTITLLGIPGAPQYRHTLRVYEADARERTRVLIRIWVNDEPAPRTSFVRTLEVSQATTMVGSTPVPIHPGYLQFDLRQLVTLSGQDLMRIEVEPVDPGMRIWSFVSITNNDTHHVTTVTPQ